MFFRFWESIQKFDEAIELNPDNPKSYEMKAQVCKIVFFFSIVLIFPGQKISHESHLTLFC